MGRLLRRLIPLGMGLIFIGVVLMMVGAVMRSGAGKGMIFIFPFYFGTVESPVGLSILLIMLALVMLPILVPWVLGPRRNLRTLRPAPRPALPPEGAPKEAKKGERRNYYLTVDVGDVDARTITIRATKRQVQVHGTKTKGGPFMKNFEFPDDTEIELVEHEHSDNFLILRVQVTEG